MNKFLSRRDALGGNATVATLDVSALKEAGATDHPDAELLDLFARWQRAEQAYITAQRAADFDPKIPVDPEVMSAAEFDRAEAWKTVEEVVDLIVGCRAHSFHGVAVKLRIVREYNTSHQCDPGTPEAALLVSLFEDMEAANV